MGGLKLSDTVRALPLERAVSSQAEGIENSKDRKFKNEIRYESSS